MSQDNLLNKLTTKGTYTNMGNIVSKGNLVSAVDQSLYRFKPPVTRNVKSPFSTPLAQAAVKAPVHIPFTPRTTPTSTVTTVYLTTEAGENLLTENNDNLIL